MTSKLTTAAGLLLAALLAAGPVVPAARADEAAGAGKGPVAAGIADGATTRVTVMAVKAVPASPGVEAGVGPGLEDVAAKLQRLPFARYEAVSTTDRDLPAGETMNVAFGDGGRFVLVAKPTSEGTHLAVQEFAPGASKPCLASESKVQKGRTQVTFCDGVPEKAATLVFLTIIR